MGLTKETYSYSYRKLKVSISGNIMDSWLTSCRQLSVKQSIYITDSCLSHDILMTYKFLAFVSYIIVTMAMVT